MHIVAALLAVLLHAAAVRAEAPAIVLAKVFDSAANPADFLVSEKYDGVRAIWDGKALKFRSGNAVSAPAWFIEKLPPDALDGELWIARGQFERLSGIVRKSPPVDAEWREVKYMIFELPNAPGTFEQRYAAILAITRRIGPPLEAVEQVRVNDRAALMKRFNAVVKGGGEGLMLHRADAPYVTGRSDVLLKLKPRDDTEAKVVAHVPGKGKYAGMLGALTVEMPDGRRFDIGSGFSDDQRREPPAVGTTITYTYRGFTRTGLPRFATFLRVREAF